MHLLAGMLVDKKWTDCGKQKKKKKKGKEEKKKRNESGDQK